MMKKYQLNASFIFIFIFISFLFGVSCSRNHNKKLFTLLDSRATGIDFNNLITESDSLNIFNSEFLYNGGGVAVGDLNGDGLQDLYFTGNQVENKLYLNKGHLKFEDITQKANVQKQKGQWSAGVNLIDLNQDGKLDIYVCNTFQNNPDLRKNLLFVNQGNDASGVPNFKEMAADYGIADTTHSANAQFFDYDNDGDLDLFIAVNFMDTKYPNQYMHKVMDGSSPNRDVLYENTGENGTGHPVFKDVSLKAGIKLDGYSHSALITDFNKDGWMDIYVANDYVTNDLIYINQKNGTFKNEIATIFKHQAASAMGSDVADINNDGLLDLFTTEMLPYYNKRKKVFLNANNYTNYVNNDVYNYEYQYTRNVLQLNQGINPETHLPIFSDVAFLSEVHETEWSWSSLMADLDNDGLKDLFVTNGFPKDVTDHDFGAFRSEVSSLYAPVELQKRIPQIKSPKFAFKNNGNLSFVNNSKSWGLDAHGFSNGAAYADLDNDGDLDLVVNNIDDKAFVFQNHLNDGASKTPYLRLQLVGEKGNLDAFGSSATIFYQGGQQISQMVSARGYLSQSENVLHFGLGKIPKVDSVVIHWYNQKVTTLKNGSFSGWEKVVCGMNTLPTPAYALAEGIFQPILPQIYGFETMHRDSDYVDFNIQKTLPHKFSQYGASLSVGDVNGDGLDDIYRCAGAQADGLWLIQTKDGKFTQQSVNYKSDSQKKEIELGTLLFDADGDGDLDLYIVHGGYVYEAQSPYYQDVICINNGKGHFTIAQNALPKETVSGQSVKAADFDGDGDLDLFVGGRVLARAYPQTDKSFIFRNDTKTKDKPIFTDVTAQVAPELSHIGMISDALWTDFNNDNLPDLILAGEWMPITFFQNDGTQLKNVTSQTGVSDKIGWWSSLAAGDFDNDGDIDYLAGNLGENSYFKASATHPMSIYAKDFDKNGLYDPFIACYGQDSIGNQHEYFYPTRDDMIKQLILIRRKFQTYGAFGQATVQDVFTKEELQGAQILKANWLKSSYLENKGNGQFVLTALPSAAQMAPIYGILPYDFDKNGSLDVLLVGNDYGMELLQGRADAFNGLVLKNMGQQNFKPLTLEETHFYVPNDAKSLTRVAIGQQKELIVASQNKGAFKVFAPKTPAVHLLLVLPNEVKAIITFKNGQRQLKEFYRGSTFLSQESRTIQINNAIQSIDFYDIKNKLTRKHLN
jgi:hypothetical protein